MSGNLQSLVVGFFVFEKMSYYQEPNDVYRELMRVTMESQKKDELILELEKERDYLRV